MAKFLYKMIIEIFYIPFVLMVFLRKFYNKEDKIKFKEKILPNKIKRPEGFLFWFHVASIGELNSVFPLIDFFLKQNSKYNILITTVTLSSYNQLKKKYKNNSRIFHQFLPYDSVFLVNSFFDNWKPDIVSFIDSEIWPNFILKIKKTGLPFILLNARITQKTFKRWKILNKFAYELFGSFSVSISSSKETADYLNLLKSKNIKYFGNFKFCSSVSESQDFDKSEFLPVQKKKMWCAVSTHPGEEVFCGNVHKILKNTEKDVLTIIIPRHINRIKKICLNLKKMGFRVQIKNELDLIDKSAEIVLVNYYGSVLKYLRFIKQIFIGKSLLKKLKNVGGQNPIDAAKIGCQVYHGPYVYNFKEIYDYLNKEKIAKKINTPEALAEKLIENFDTHSSKKINDIDHLKIYSEEIFKKVIDEYKKFIK